MFNGYWEFLRAKTRFSVLAGVQDALDILEGSEEGERDSSYDQAMRLVTRFGGSAETLMARGKSPHASIDSPVETTPKEAPSEDSLTDEPVTVASAGASRSPAEGSAFNDELEGRLRAAATRVASQGPSEPSQNGPRTQRHQPVQPPVVTKRGRPRKEPTK